MDIKAKLFDDDGLLNQASAQVTVTASSIFDSANTIGAIVQLLPFKDYTVVKGLTINMVKDEAGRYQLIERESFVIYGKDNKVIYSLWNQTKSNKIQTLSLYKYGDQLIKIEQMKIDIFPQVTISSLEIREPSITLTKTPKSKDVRLVINKQTDNVDIFFDVEEKTIPPTPPAPPASSSKLLYIIIGVVIVVALVAAGVWYWTMHIKNRSETDYESAKTDNLNTSGSNI